MKFYTFEQEQTKIEGSYGSYYDLFEIFMYDKRLKDMNKYSYIVTLETEGRLDKVSSELYEDSKYVEELMLINNIINPFSIKSGDVIIYVSIADIMGLYLDKEDKKDKKDVLNINNPKTSRQDSNRTNSVLPPIIKDKNAKQVLWNKDNKTITINNKIG